MQYSFSLLHKTFSCCCTLTKNSVDGLLRTESLGLCCGDLCTFLGGEELYKNEGVGKYIYSEEEVKDEERERERPGNLICVNNR